MENMEPEENRKKDEKVDTFKNSESPVHEHKMTNNIQLLKQRIQLLEKEIEQLKYTQSREVVARSIVGTRCCKLQRQNKAIRDEIMKEIQKVKKERKMMAYRFQSDIKEIDDIALAIIKRMDNEFRAEKQRFTKEKDIFDEQIKFHKAQRINFEINLKTLEEHISLYMNKYKYFEEVILKGNKIFDTFKVEVNHMRQNIQKLSLENKMLKDKWLQTQHVINEIGVTENNESCEISAITEENSIVLDSVDTDNSKTDLSVCVNVEEQVNLPAQKQNLRRQLNTDTNKNKSKGQDLKMNKK